MSGGCLAGVLRGGCEARLWCVCGACGRRLLGASRKSPAHIDRLLSSGRSEGGTSGATAGRSWSAAETALHVCSAHGCSVTVSCAAPSLRATRRADGAAGREQLPLSLRARHRFVRKSAAMSIK